MRCDKCGNEHDGSYASGRFCSVECSNSRTHTSESRSKISLSLRKSWKSSTRKSRRKQNYKFTPEVLQKIYLRKELEKERLYKERKFNELGIEWLRKKIFEEQNKKCNKCKNDKWLDEPIILELHHKDTNRKNKDRNNLELLCLNCHATTDNFKFKGRKHKEESRYKIKISNRKKTK